MKKEETKQVDSKGNDRQDVYVSEFAENQNNTEGKAQNVSVDLDVNTSGEVVLTEETVAKKRKRRRMSVLYLANISLLSAVATVLLFLKFPILPAVSHLELNISDLPSLIAAFMYGPVSGIIVSSIRVAVYFAIRGTGSFGVGEISNLISGAVYAIVAGLIYKFMKSKKGAVIALIVSSVAFVLAQWLLNKFLLLPFYANFMEMFKDPEIVRVTLWWTCLFNAIKTTITAFVTYFVYKPLSKAMHWEFNSKPKKTEKQEKSKP